VELFAQRSVEKTSRLYREGVIGEGVENVCGESKKHGYRGEYIVGKYFNAINENIVPS